MFSKELSMKHIIITGSTRGIGFGMAGQFLKNGHRVTISGTSQAHLNSAVRDLASRFDVSMFQGFICDVVSYDSLLKLWDEAVAKFGKADVWINNAGINQESAIFNELKPFDIERVIRTNTLGIMYGTHAAYNRMLLQGSGQIYNMEGFGSNGMKMKNLTLYGTSKSAVRYFTESFILETKGSPILVGTLSPGMVFTDFILDPIRKNPEKISRNRNIYDILADDVETVTKYLVNGILKNKKHGAKIHWLTGGKIFLRFLTAAFRKKNRLDKYLHK
jgi:NAD(P)-dependent dehydrogenase (short-subunit alcohol dehydrogenase family)